MSDDVEQTIAARRARRARAASDSGAAAALRLAVDVPSAATCTGDKVVLDGHDVALLRITLVDANGAPLLGVFAEDVNVTVDVVSGPGRVLGTGNGKADSHQRPTANAIQTYGGLARAVIQASLDCTTDDRGTTTQVDTGTRGRTKVLAGACPSPLRPIVVRATVASRASAAAGKSTSLEIQVSGDAGDGALAVARRSEPCTFTYIDEFPM